MALRCFAIAMILARQTCTMRQRVVVEPTFPQESGHQIIDRNARVSGGRRRHGHPQDLLVVRAAAVAAGLLQQFRYVTNCIAPEAARPPIDLAQEACGARCINCSVRTTYLRVYRLRPAKILYSIAATSSSAATVRLLVIGWRRTRWNRLRVLKTRPV